MAFDNVRLPADVEVGAHGGPAFQTTIVQFSNGTEQRNADWHLVRHSFDVGYGIGDFEDFITVRNFFFARRGRWRGFRFKHWDDFNLTNETLGTGTGSNHDFPLIKTYEATGPFPYVRSITRPVSGTETVYLDGVVQTTGFSFTGDTSSTLHFTSSPGNGVVVSVDCEFDIPVRFDVEKFDFTIEGFEAGSLSGLTVMEIRE